MDNMTEDEAARKAGGGAEQMKLDIFDKIWLLLATILSLYGATIIHPGLGLLFLGAGMFCAVAARKVEALSK